jgi:type IV pilus assembly protein PilA
MFKRIRGERGFTLVELLVVLAILAILIAIVVPNLAGLTGGAKARAAQSELDVVQTAMDAMIAKNEVITVQPRITGATVAIEDSVTVYVVATYDPATETETHKAAKGTILLRSVSHGEYTWDLQGRVAQTAYD